MGLIENCKAHFGADNLYEVLSVEKSASESDLKKAYRKVSLVVHPDRVAEHEKENATRKFQVLAQVYFILSDKEKRLAYDETGCVDEENAFPEDKDWSDYWRILFPKIQMQNIENFLKKYRGSEEEIEDLKECYIKCKGDMDQMIELLIGYTLEEEERYREILDDLIEKEEIPRFPKFNEKAAKKSARKARLTKEAKKAEKLRKEMKIDDEEALVAAVNKRSLDRESQFDDMIKNLESKYAKPTRNSNRKKKST